MDFELALKALKAGSTVTRLSWVGATDISKVNRDITLRAQFPDKDSMNTEPYLVMNKRGKVFPVDLSCESIFADDWIVFVDDEDESCNKRFQDI